jgi:two-component system response regulator AtoC
MIEKILVAEDDKTLRQFIAEVLKRGGYQVTLVSDGAQAIDALGAEAFDLVITDLMMPLKTGMEVLKAAKALAHNPPVILATAHGSVETAVEAMRLGAFHFLLKPFSPEALEVSLQKVAEHLKLRSENRFLRDVADTSLLIAESATMRRTLAGLEKIAKSQASVFITGESGTGKEVIAAEIHRLSARDHQPFIKVNCAAIPETLIESEFFGHEKGAFTGALTRKIGRFELADKGTLLLDEVTEIPLSLQAKLLRAIQEMEFERVGGMRSVKVNVRILSTSNRSMFDAIESKVFREDLYYRLNVVPIHLPSLRERSEDILPLAAYFLRKFCLENHKPVKSFTPGAIQKLLAYHWPGNVRELANIIERTVVLDFHESIDQEHLYLEAPSRNCMKSHGAFPTGMTLHEMEKRLILETLRAQGDNRKKTAAILGISIRTLRNKLHEYGEAQEGDS